MKKISCIAILAMIMACPSFADIAANNNNPTCDNTTVGATSGDTALDAVWNANTLNLKFMANGQEFASNTCTYGQNITIPTGTPTRTGYNFAGWAVHEETVTYVGCSSIPDETTCGLYSNYGCHWYNNTCFGAGDPYSISNQEWCEAEGFYWCTEDRGGTMEPFCEYENDPC